jgi:hypothetical protein
MQLKCITICIELSIPHISWIDFPISMFIVTTTIDYIRTASDATVIDFYSGPSFICGGIWIWNAFIMLFGDTSLYFVLIIYFWGRS